MSGFSQVPFNVDVLSFGPKDLRYLLPITSLDTFVGHTKNFNPEGLYSTVIFGVVGSSDRKKRYSYIDLKTPIITPVLYKALGAVKSLYLDILASKAFAVWNPDTRDFDRSNAIDGRTGFDFFTQYLNDIVFPNNDTESRQEAVAILDKYRDKFLMRYLTVIPAGYREYELSEDGREMTNEINEFYTGILAISNTINETTFKISPAAFDSQRKGMQLRVMDLYDLFSKMIEGKRGIIINKFASRRINNGTRNVITANSTIATRLGDPNNVSMNDTMAGLYQVARALAPLTFYQLRERFLSRAMSVPGAPVRLCNKETLLSERTLLDSSEYTKWLSEEGLESLINSFKDETIRDKPVEIGGRYLGLTYRGPDMTFALLSGLDDLPSDGSRLVDHCTPITYAELMYHALYPVARRHFAIVTRYPITGVGSTYPSRIYLKSTIASEKRQELDPQLGWEKAILPYEISKEATEFPVKGSPYFNAMSPHASRLAGLGGD